MSANYINAILSLKNFLGAERDDITFALHLANEVNRSARNSMGPIVSVSIEFTTEEKASYDFTTLSYTKQVKPKCFEQSDTIFQLSFYCCV